MRRTLYTHTRSVRALPITTIGINGIRKGSVVDLGEFGNDFRDILFLVYCGAITDGTHAFTVEDSDDGVTYTAVAAGQILGDLPSVVAADDFRQNGLDFGVINARQYVRLVVTSSGVTSGGIIGATAVVSEGSTAPAVRTGS